MNAGVGAARARDFNGLAKEFGERGFQRAGDGTNRRLPLETAELRAVVLDGKTQSR